MGIAVDMFLLVSGGAGTILTVHFLLMVLRHGRGSDDYPPMSNRISLAFLLSAAALLLFDSTILMLLLTLTDMGVTSSMFAFSGHTWVGVTLGAVAVIALGLALAGIVLDPHAFGRRDEQER